MENKKQKKNWLLITFFWLLIFLLILIFAVLYVQPSVFYPWHDSKSYEVLKNVEGFEEIKIQNGKNTISGWVKYNKDKSLKSPLVIMYGGNGQNSSNTCNWFYEDKIFETVFKDYNFLIVDYPSYGLSTGYLSEKTMFDTAIKAYEYAEKQEYVDKDKIVVLGFSIGTGVANYVTSEKNPNGLVLVAPYDRALSLYNNAINIFHGPIKLLTRYKFDSISYAEKIKTNPLVITSIDDEVINYKLSENLFTFYKNNPEYMCIDGALHNDYFLRQEVLDKISDYLENKLK